MNKRRIAIEWIVFLLSSLAGMAVLPAVIYILWHSDSGMTMGQGYKFLLDEMNGIYLFPMVTYLFVLLVRSIIWAIKFAGQKEIQS